jgi:hypothetical protein
VRLSSRWPMKEMVVLAFCSRVCTGMSDRRHDLIAFLHFLFAREMFDAIFEPRWAEFQASWIRGLAEGKRAQLFSKRKTAGRGILELMLIMRGTWSER